MVSDLTHGFTEQDEAEFVRLLRLWNDAGRGRISNTAFPHLAWMVPQPIVEVVGVRKKNGVVETLLLKRPNSDPTWPGMMHTPGTALRTSDFDPNDTNPLQKAFERLQRGELNVSFSREPVYVGFLDNINIRGAEVKRIFWTEIPSDAPLSDNVQWFPVDQLASNPQFIQAQLPFVLMAAEHYLRNR